MGLFTGPITEAERRAWQRRAHRVLGNLLNLDLPPLVWTVTDSLTLVGRAQQPDPVERRAAWEAWANKLEAKRWPERTSGGFAHLHAVVEKYADNVTVAITADVDEGDE